MNLASDQLPPGASILFVHYGDNWMRGSELCLLNMVVALQELGLQPIVWCNAAVLEQSLSHHNIRVHRTDMPILFGYGADKYNLKGWLKLLKQGCNLITQYQPAIVHINGGAPAQWMNTACWLMNTPHILQLHAHYGVLKDRVTLGFHCCKNILGVSHAAIRALIQDGMNEQKLSILPNSINAQQLEQKPAISLKTQLGLAPNDKLFLSVGSLIERKGHSTLFHSVALLKQLGHEVYVAIIGDGPYRKTLEGLCLSLNIQKQVFFLGEHASPFSLMSGDANALVSTSRDEVFGLVLAEANLARLPVIAPNIPGINSVIIDKKTGFLYKPNSSEALAKSILNLKNNIQDYPVVAKGYWRATRVFSQEQHLKKLVNHYAKVIATGDSTPNYAFAFILAIKGLGMRCARVMRNRLQQYRAPHHRDQIHG